MKYIRYGFIIAAIAVTIIARQFWIPRQVESTQSYQTITPEPNDYVEYDIKLFGKDDKEAVAEYKATYIPRGRTNDGRYYVRLLDRERLELTDYYTVLHLRPEKMAEGHFVIFSSVYLEGSEGRRERSAPSATTGLPAFDPLTGTGYLAFDTRRLQGGLKLVITYAVDLGSNDAYGPAFAEVVIRDD